ncbi:unnamed protein product [Blepharisma stoltei]|uniref:Transmembrane protein n=1 Tax=Blepharisma stoltei TaxID=1481888 RepID=A0AAU9JA24_9CILI|nr:unnamed protein product [Blepharisma stoltei]
MNFHKDLMKTVGDKLNWRKASISSAIGAGLGIGVSFIINSTLAEISINPFFSVYFGILFMIVGAVIISRVQQQSNEETKRKYYFAFGVLVVLSGILCFLLEKNWSLGLGPHLKIPLYAILGISVSFALTFAIVDLMNYFSSYFSGYSGKVIVENPQQISAILVLSSIMGVIFGLIFGILDVEDQTAYQLRIALMKEQLYCYPIGAILGALSGVMNEYLKTDYIQPPDQFDEEI